MFSPVSPSRPTMVIIIQVSSLYAVQRTESIIGHTHRIRVLGYRVSVLEVGPFKMNGKIYNEIFPFKSISGITFCSLIWPLVTPDASLQVIMVLMIAVVSLYDFQGPSL